MRVFLTMSIVLFSSVFSVNNANAQEGRNPEIEMITVDVHVADENGRSISKAEVKPFGFRTKLERGSHYGWNPAAHGEQPNATTDKDGNATLQVPRFVYEKLEIGEITWVVDHYDFVVYNADHLVEESPAELVVEIRLSYRRDRR